jgi:hypothetical protein
VAVEVAVGGTAVGTSVGGIDVTVGSSGADVGVAAGVGGTHAPSKAARLRTITNWVKLVL